MIDSIHVVKVNESYLRVECDPGIAYELTEYFTFKVPGYQFSPKYKAGVWDGRIRLFNPVKRTLYLGLFSKIEKFCKDREYEFTFTNEFADVDVCADEVKKFIADLGLPADRKPRHYQIKALIKCLRKQRLLLLSPTNSGKSLIIYMLCKWFGLKSLIIVPTTTLVHQMAGDFVDYNYDQPIHKIVDGEKNKNPTDLITMSTWQAIYKQPLEWFQQFDVVIGDEAHGFAAPSLSSIMEKLTSTRYRFGTTGTLDDLKLHKLVLEGLFGEIYKSISQAEMIEQGYSSKLDIKAIVLKYPDEQCQLISKAKYKDEVAWLVTNDRRNKFIKNLVKSLPGNTLVLFHFKAHGKIHREMLEEACDCPIYFIDGGVLSEDRDDIRKIINEHEKSILLGSMKTTATGLNMPNINNIVFIHPSKAKITTLQAIGRGLRKTSRKNNITLYDIADDLQWKKKKNFTLKHFYERIDIYTEEKFPYKLYTVQVKNDG